MRLSKMFSTTLRDAPAGTEAVSAQLLLRAGYIRQLGAGLYSYLPLAKRAITKIENIIREEMNAIDGQEITMPVVHPAEIWQQSGRWHTIDAEMARFKDRKDHDMVLAMTHEEVVATLAASEIKSYRQLPQMVYHLQTKFRDDPRPRAGLIRVREFTMKDSYSLDVDQAGLDAQYQAHYAAYFRIFARCGLPVIAVGSDVGMMGGSGAHEYMFLTDIGEDTLVLCDSCGYAANKQVAAFAKSINQNEPAKAMEKVSTPGTKTIETLAQFLGVPSSQTAKAFMVMATIDGAERFVFAVIRGDMDVNETKLANAVKASALRPATEAEIRAVGAVPGYASPINLALRALGVPVAPRSLGAAGALSQPLRALMIVIVDDSIPTSPNLAAGANEEGYHLINTNYGRDYTAQVVADIASAGDGCACVQCGAPLRTSRGVEVGNIFKLGTKYSAAMGATFLDADGQSKPIVMGSYGIGVGRLLACVAEAHHDEAGLMWPAAISPFHAHLVVLPGKDGAAQAMAERVYASLQAAGVDVLFDDRAESPGVKFADADLIGLPARITVSGRALAQGGVEVKRRNSAEKTIVPEAELAAWLKTALKD